MMYRVRGAILIGILLTSIISWPRGTPVTYFPHTDAGDALFDYFKKVVTFHKLQKIGNAIDVSLNYIHIRVRFKRYSFTQYHYGYVSDSPLKSQPIVDSVTEMVAFGML
jgi:AGZA family xanthine/uracil permease-like MFS transporter